MGDYLGQVRVAVSATTIHSATSYSCFGRDSPALEASVEEQLTPRVKSLYLVAMIGQQLYGDFYCQGAAESLAGGVRSPTTVGTGPFISALSTANSGEGWWQEGWAVTGADREGVAATRDGLTLHAPLDHCRSIDGRPTVAGAAVAIRLPKEWFGRSPGYYLALADVALDPPEPSQVVRLYWNVTASGAVGLMRQATMSLNRAGLGFHLKVISNPNNFRRCDAAVVYLHRPDVAAALEVLDPVYRSLAESMSMKLRTPAFTKRLAPGLGLAENPHAPQSFGMHRCELVAQGLVDAFEGGVVPDAERLDIVVRRLARAGVRIETPYLNPDAVDDYELPHRPPRRHDPAPAGPTTVGFLGMAARLGRRLCDQAVWHGDRCAWLAADIGRGSSGPRGAMPYHPTGPDLYSGSAGIGLFLAELGAATGDEAALRTAAGAIGHALSSIDRVISQQRLGLHSGWPGIALAATRVGAHAGRPDIVEEAAALAHRCLDEVRTDTELDLLLGLAGGVVGLLRLSRALGDPTLVDGARNLGDRLLRAASRPLPGVLAWGSPAFPDRMPLTGLGHGTAGVGLAMVELYEVTGDAMYREAAARAYAYERAWFSGDEANWPDLRELPPGTKPTDPYSRSFMVAWCHGAAGIALSRLRAWEVLGDEACRTEAIAALDTTKRVVEADLRDGVVDFSLCHGLGGNADVLLHGHQALGPERWNGLEVATAAGKAGIESYGRGTVPWPCATGLGETPDLMLGLAGIGTFYLRLNDPTVPSALSMHPVSRPAGYPMSTRTTFTSLTARVVLET